MQMQAISLFGALFIPLPDTTTFGCKSVGPICTGPLSSLCHTQPPSVQVCRSHCTGPLPFLCHTQAPLVQALWVPLHGALAVPVPDTTTFWCEVCGSHCTGPLPFLVPYTTTFAASLWVPLNGALVIPLPYNNNLWCKSVGPIARGLLPFLCHTDDHLWCKSVGPIARGHCRSCAIHKHLWCKSVGPIASGPLAVPAARHNHLWCKLCRSIARGPWLVPVPDTTTFGAESVGPIARGPCHPSATEQQPPAGKLWVPLHGASGRSCARHHRLWCKSVGPIARGHCCSCAIHKHLWCKSVGPIAWGSLPVPCAIHDSPLVQVSVSHLHGAIAVPVPYTSTFGASLWVPLHGAAAVPSRHTQRSLMHICGSYLQGALLFFRQLATGSLPSCPMSPCTLPAAPSHARWPRHVHRSRTRRSFTCTVAPRTSRSEQRPCRTAPVAGAAGGRDEEQRGVLNCLEGRERGEGEGGRRRGREGGRGKGYCPDWEM